MEYDPAGAAYGAGGPQAPCGTVPQEQVVLSLVLGEEEEWQVAPEMDKSLLVPEVQKTWISRGPQGRVAAGSVGVYHGSLETLGRAYLV